jgi:hypothetical protein
MTEKAGGGREIDSVQGGQRKGIWHKLGEQSMRLPVPLWDRIHNRPFTAIGIALALVACTRPQVLHILADLPWSGKVPEGIVRTIVFIVAAGLLVSSAICAMVLVVPAERIRTDEELAGMPRRWRWLGRAGRWISTGSGREESGMSAPAAAPTRLGQFWRWIRSGRFLSDIADLYPALDASLQRDGHLWKGRALGAGFLLTALLWVFMPVAAAEQSPAMAVILRQLLAGLGLAASGLWFLIRRSDPNAFRRRTFGRYVFMITLALAFGEITWSLPDWPTPDFIGGRLSFRFYTIWGVLFLLFLIVATGRIADRASVAARLVLVIVVVVVSQADSGFVVDTRAITNRAQLVQAFSDETEEWFERLEQRIRKGRSDRPIVVVAASGGGSRAAMFAGLVFEYLDHVRFDGAPAVEPAESIGHNVAAISSVSGGSLATAYYLRGPKQPKREQPHNFIADEVATNLVAVADEWVDMAEKCQRSPETCVSLDDVVVRRRRSDAFPEVRKAVASLPVRGPEDATWLFQSAIVDDMATDFMAPLLRGVLTPFLERGHSVSDFWAERFGWNGIQQHGCWGAPAKVAGRWTCDWSKRRPPPLAMLNATNVKTGKRVVVGYPSLPAYLLGSEMTALSDHGGAFDLTLADGARLSANFPWGFEIGLFDPTHETTLLPFPNLRARLKLTDGGVTDNSGLDTVATMLERLEFLSRPPKTDALPAENTRDEFLARRARTIRDLLLQQGLMLVEIDSGARPSPTGVLGRLFPGITDPLDALSLAGWGGANTMKAGHIARVSQALEKMAGHQNRDLDPNLDRTRLFYHLPFVCNHTEGVMTAWALGPKDKATIMASFLVEAHANGDLLAENGPSREQTDRDIQSEAAASVAEADKVGSAVAAQMSRRLVQELRQVEEDRKREDVEEISITVNVAALAEQRASANAARGFKHIAPSVSFPNSPPPKLPEPAPAGAVAVLPGSLPRAGAVQAPVRTNSQLAGKGATGAGAGAGAPKGNKSSPSATVPSEPVPAAAGHAYTTNPADRRGWLYLGHYDDTTGSWRTSYLSVPGSPSLPELKQLRPGQQLAAKGRVNVRVDVPDADASFAAVKSVLRPGATVTLADTPKGWRGTGFIWAEVRY